MDLEDINGRVEDANDLSYMIHEKAVEIIENGKYHDEKILYSKALELAIQEEKVLAIMEFTTVLKSALFPQIRPLNGSPGALEAIAMALHGVSIDGNNAGNITEALFDIGRSIDHKS